MTEVLVPWWRTDLGDVEIARLAAAVRGRHITQGPLCRELERGLAQQLEVPHVVVTTSGSVAVLLALLTCDVRQDDEIILPAAAFIAAAHAAQLLGARVVLVDVEPDTQRIDVTQIAAAMTTRTKVILPVHMNGRSCNMDAIRTLAKARGVAVIEDCAQAFASRAAAGWLGTLSDIGVFSMGITKLITTGEGGFLAVRDDQTYDTLIKLRNQGVRNLADNVFDRFGLNFRLTDLQAAIGLAQMERLAEKRARLHHVYAFYREHLRDLPQLRLVEFDLAGGELPLWCQVVCTDRATRDAFVAQLRARGIEAKAFHPCLSESPHLQVAGDFPNSRSIAGRGLTLPSGPDQPLEHLQRVATALHEIVAEMAPRSSAPSPARALGAALSR